jgi:hypothetical protein
MPTIEKLAENFVRAASELIEATGAMSVEMERLIGSGARAQLPSHNFNSIFGEMPTVAGGSVGSMKMCVNVSGVEFFCVTDDVDEWLKAKGYVKKEAV